jgi:L-fucose mutarotase/ribose pyranase (RbsD/FucU family)
MTALVERIIAARDRIKHLMNYGEDAVWRPAKEAHEVMADAANALSSNAHRRAETFARQYRQACDDHAVAMARVLELEAALRVALAFMEGLEGDDLQDGIDERIDTVRSALKAAEGRI